MPRGGKRDKAGRKSTWVSGAKFEDTTLLRVPLNIKEQLLIIAHELDARGKLNSEVDLEVANAELLNLQRELLECKDSNQKLQEQIKSSETKLVTNSKEDIFKDKLQSFRQILINFQERNKGLKPIEYKNKFKQLMIELDEKVFES